MSSENGMMSLTFGYRRALRICLSVFLVFLPATSQGTSVVQLADDRLTVKVHDISLKDVLEEIARISGLTLVMDRSARVQITAHFVGLPLDEGLHRLLRDQSYALEYLRERPQNDDAGRSGRLWVLLRSEHQSSFDGLDDGRDRDAGDEVVEASPMMPTALTSEDSWEREEAVEALGKSGITGAVAPLSRALVDEDEGVREAAIAALANIGGDEAAQALAIALEDANDWIREEAVEALGEIGAGDEGANTIVPLSLALIDEDGDVRGAAVAALAVVGGEDAALALGMALRDPDEWIREEAVEVLGEIGGQSALLLVRQALADEAPSVRSAAAEVLARPTNEALLWAP